MSKQMKTTKTKRNKMRYKIEYRLILIYTVVLLISIVVIHKFFGYRSSFNLFPTHPLTWNEINENIPTYFGWSLIGGIVLSAIHTAEENRKKEEQKKKIRTGNVPAGADL